MILTMDGKFEIIITRTSSGQEDEPSGGLTNKNCGGGKKNFGWILKDSN